MQFRMASLLSSFQMLLTLAVVSSKSVLDVGPSNDILESLNESVNPCTDFYDYTCGRYSEQVAPRMPIWSGIITMTFRILAQVKATWDKEDSEIDSEALRKLIKIYRTCLNTDKIEAEGVEPLMSLINDNGGWPLMMKPGEWNSKDITWQKVQLNIGSYAMDGIFSLGISNNDMNSTISKLFIAPPLKFYRRKELLAPHTDSSAKAYAVYKREVYDVLRRYSNASSEKVDNAAWTKLNNSEREIAKIISGLSDPRENPGGGKLNVMTIDEFQEFYDSANMSNPTAKIDWLEMITNPFATIMTETPMNGSYKITVFRPGYFLKMAELLNKTSPETIVNFLMWDTIRELSPYANDELRNLSAKFNNPNDVAETIEPRKFECESNLEKERAIMHAYLKEYFSEDLRKEATVIVENIQAAMEQAIRNSTWLDDTMRNKMAKQVMALHKVVAYPDDFNSTDIENYYSELTPTESYFDNKINQRIFKMKHGLKTLWEPRGDNWFVVSSMHEVMYQQLLNIIQIPAGTLQLPYFDLNRPRVMNYATLGMVAGHEIAHAADTTDLRYDEEGKFRTWSPEFEKYEEYKQCFIDQFDNYTLYENSTHIIRVNGTFTADENMADTTGLQMAWNAYSKVLKSRESRGIREPKMAGLERFSDDQIFFLAFGNLWCTYESDEYTKAYGPTDTHSPAKARVNGAVSNIKAFSEAFHCPTNSPMNPAKRCNLWK